jgi:hypothetical protein
MSNHHTLQLIEVTMKKTTRFLALSAKLFILLFWAIPNIIIAQNNSLGKNDFTIRQIILENGSLGFTETQYDLQNPSDDDEIDLNLLKSLIFDNVPTIFFVNQKIEDSNENFPQRLVSDANSIGMLTRDEEKIRTVKLLQININQTQEKSAVKLSTRNLGGFKNLTHIFIKSIFPLSKEDLTQMVSGYTNPDVIIVYQINSNF